MVGENETHHSFKPTPRYIESSTCAYLFVSYIMGLGWHAISTLLERRPTMVEVKFSQTGVPPHNVSFALIPPPPSIDLSPSRGTPGMIMPDMYVGKPI